MDCSTPAFPVHHQLPEFAQTYVHWVSDAPNHLILAAPILLLLSVFPSISVSSNELALRIRWPKYWECQVQHQSFQWIFRLIFFRIDWFNLLEVQGTFKSLFQHHSSKALILWCSAFFMVQLSHPYMTTAKTVTLTIQIQVGKVISQLFNILFYISITL